MRAFALLLACSALALAQDGATVELLRGRGYRLVVTAATAANGSPAVRNLLRQEVAVDFRDARVGEVAHFLRRAAGLNVVVHPKLLAAGAPITFTASRMRLDHVVDWLARLGDFEVQFVDEALYLTREPWRGPVRTVVYDITDLVGPVRDFPGPELALSGRGELQIAPPWAAVEAEAESANALADLVREHLAPAP